jgi:hypothetical protein
MSGGRSLVRHPLITSFFLAVSSEIQLSFPTSVLLDTRYTHMWAAAAMIKEG